MFIVRNRRFPVSAASAVAAACLAVLALLVPLSLPAQTLSSAGAQAILKEIDTMSDFPGKDFSALFTIVSTKPGEKDSVTQARVFRRDTNKQFTILIMLPEVNKGQGYLREDQNVWFYDPTSRKFSHSSIKENLQNTEAKNSDFTKSSLVDDYTVESISEGKIAIYPVWILDLKAKTNEVTYDKLKLYVRKDKTLLLERQDFSVNGRLMRTTYYPKYVELDGKFLSSQMLIIDEINVGQKSQITMAEQSVAPLPDKVFTKAFLEQVSR